MNVMIFWSDTHVLFSIVLMHERTSKRFHITYFRDALIDAGYIW